MNMWKFGKKVASYNKTGIRKDYGIEAWVQYQTNHNLYYVTFNDNFYSNFTPLMYFFEYQTNNCENKYMYYKKNYNYKGSLEKYINDCKEICSIIDRYDTSLIEIFDNTLFKSKELTQLLFLIKEIYKYGSYNIPSCRFDYRTKTIRSHPGQHLCFTRIFLGLPLSCFFSIKKEDNAGLEILKNNSKNLQLIESDNQIMDILKAKKIAAFIQQYLDVSVPGFYPYSKKYSKWQNYDKNGHTLWPGNDIDINALWWLNYFHDDSFYNLLTVKKTFPDNRIEKNNAFAFMLTNSTEDENFKLLRTI